MIYSWAEKSVYSLMLGTFSPLIISIYSCDRIYCHPKNKKDDKN